MLIVDLSRNFLTKRLSKFLESEKSLRNQSQARIEIMNHIEKSILLLHHIFKDTKSLKSLQIYDKINAKSMNELFQNFLKIKSKKEFVYDVRTVELARLMYEISSQFISSSPQLSHDKFLKEDLEKISLSFTTLTKSVLQQYVHENLSKDKEEQLKKSVRNIELEIQKIIDKNKGLQKLQNQLRKLNESKQKTIHQTDYFKTEIERLKFVDHNLSNQSLFYQKHIELNEISISNIDKKIKNLETKLLKNKKLCELWKTKKSYEKKLSKFEELQEYFSPIKPLEESNKEQNYFFI